MTPPWPTTAPTRAELATFADAEPRSFWTREPLDALPVLRGVQDADLCIVGGGFTGLWAALHAKADDPARDVVLVEAESAGFGASGRNGGFLVSSLTHGLANGLARFGPEMETLERLGTENYDGLRADLQRHGIDCDFQPTGELTVLLEPHELEWLDEEAELLRRFGHTVEVFPDAAAMQAEVASPTYQAGLCQTDGAAIVDPGKLVAGLRAAALGAGVRMFEHSPVSAMRREGDAVDVFASQGRVRARRVLLATSAHRSLLPSVRHRVLAVYDYVLVSEPLSAAQLASIGWSRRQGIGDAANRFHYYRLTADNRILWGGYDAIYRFGGRVGPQHDESAAVFGRLAQHFFTTFPQLRGLRFTHRWGGAIDTCSRFSVFFGTAHGGRVSHATGYTGLGVGAARFGARVALDLVDGRDTEATRLRYVRAKPVPFPPEPLRYAVVQATRNRLAAADEAGGRRGAWLRTLDRLGLGFDS